MANSTDPNQPIDLDQHCLQRQGISRFSRTRVKMLIPTAADNILLFIYFFYYFSKKIILGISCESSALQMMIHMKCQFLFSLENEKKKKKIKMPSAAVVISSLRVKMEQMEKMSILYLSFFRIGQWMGGTCINK